MFVSLIMPTIGRAEDVDILMSGLVVQTYADFELIVLDQNDDDRLLPIIEKYKDRLNIKYIKSDKKGLSYNRNLGLDNAVGEIIGFPDDDCEYNADTVEKVVNFFKENEDCKIYSCRSMDRNMVDSFLKMYDDEREITRDNVLFTAISITMFFRFEDKSYHRFDERLGAGAEFGSGEDVDYVLELLSRGYKGRYFGGDIIYHPEKKHVKSKAKAVRDFNYGRGFGAMCKKEVIYRRHYKFITHISYRVIRNIGGIVLNKNRDYHTASMKGRIQGFFGYKELKKK
ncbi:MAG: glycosyltransferase family 2 protein [Clostridioides sp.]|jgi:glycosyltransferase involved in cell wall biosynthesis|nr:glycosyltransferase family 2 protein [Clostridioides sp.]